MRFFQISNSLLPIFERENGRPAPLSKRLRAQCRLGDMGGDFSANFKRCKERLCNAGASHIYIPNNLSDNSFWKLLSIGRGEGLFFATIFWKPGEFRFVITLKRLPSHPQIHHPDRNAILDICRLMILPAQHINIIEPTRKSLILDYKADIIEECKNFSCNIFSIIFSFIDILETHTMSADLRNYFINYIVISIESPFIVLKQLDDLRVWKEIHRYFATNFGNRDHMLLGIGVGTCYFWKGGTTLFCQKVDGVLRDIFLSCYTTLPHLTNTPDCLVTIYNQEWKHLRYHTDIFEGIPEMVTLFFSGAPRDLEFKWRNSSEGGFRKVYACRPGDMLVITPLANELTMHRKLKGQGGGPSTSFAFRRTITIKELVDRHKRRARESGINVDMLNTLEVLGIT